jgi:hypothetical protein
MFDGNSRRLDHWLIDDSCIVFRKTLFPSLIREGGVEFHHGPPFRKYEGTGSQDRNSGLEPCRCVEDIYCLESAVREKRTTHISPTTLFNRVVALSLPSTPVIAFNAPTALSVPGQPNCGHDDRSWGVREWRCSHHGDGVSTLLCSTCFSRHCPQACYRLTPRPSQL